MYGGNMPVVPTIFEKNGGGSIGYDIFSKLLKERIVIVGADDINLDTANMLIAQLLYLDSDGNQPINMYINSPGGSVHAGLAIYDTMQQIKSPINTICMGIAMSFGAVLLTAGAKGSRSSLPHSRIMIHQPLIHGGGISGQATDIAIEAEEMAFCKKQLSELIAYHTGKSYKQVVADCERNRYMTPQEAVEYGLIDNVITPPKGFGSIIKP
jgi:ATP-dependent Clp protease protease subunit